MSRYRGHLLLQQQPRSPAIIARARQGHPRVTTSYFCGIKQTCGYPEFRSPHNNNIIIIIIIIIIVLYLGLYVHFTHVGGLGQTWGPAVCCPGWQQWPAAETQQWIICVTGPPLPPGGHRRESGQCSATHLTNTTPPNQKTTATMYKSAHCILTFMAKIEQMPLLVKKRYLQTVKGIDYLNVCV